MRAGELVKAARVAVGNRSGREQGAVAAAHVDKLDAAGIRARGHRRVHAARAAAAEHGDADGAVQPVKAGVAVRGRTGGIHGAVLVYADQLDAAVPLGRDQGVLFALAQVERGDAARAVELQVAVAVVERVHPLQGAVPVYADQLDAVVVVPGNEGVLFALAQVEHGSVERVVEL